MGNGKKFKLQYHRDPERAEQIKQIKGGKKYSGELKIHQRT
jgi:hypothetical protein